MKIKLLKKLRKRAYKKVGMMCCINPQGRMIYKIDYRKRLNSDNWGIVREYYVDSATKELNNFRRNLILLWVTEKRVKNKENKQKKQITKINKQIKKL